MRLKATLTAIALSLLASCASIHPSDEICRSLEGGELLTASGAPHQPGSTALTRWTINSDDGLNASTPPQIQRWQHAVRARMNTDPIWLLERAPSTNNALVLANHSWIGSIRCVEALLLQEQHRRIPPESAPTEFAAFFLRSPDGRQWRIYNYTRNIDGIGNVGPITQAITPDLEADWRLIAVLHNHNPRPGQDALNGVVAPSGPDAGLAQSLANDYGLEELWITNGFDTVRIPRSAFGQFSTRD